MSPIIEPKRAYTKPRVNVQDRNRIRKSGIVYNIPKGKFYGRYISEDQIRILEELTKKGLPVEELFLISKANPRRGTKFTISLDHGVSLYDSIIKNRDNPKLILKYLDDVKNIVATMHNNGISFGHAHFNNFVVDSTGKVRIIDFKEASRTLHYLEPSTVLDSFYLDYLNMDGSLCQLGFTNAGFRLNFFNDIISKYNMPDGLKKEFLDLVRKDVLRASKLRIKLGF